MKSNLILAKPRIIEVHELCIHLDTAAAVRLRLYSGTQELLFCRHHFIPQLTRLRIEGARLSDCMGEIIASSNGRQVNLQILDALRRRSGLK